MLFCALSLILFLSVCPEQLYVATSRAENELHLLGEDLPGDHLPFLDKEAMAALILDGDLVVIPERSTRDATGQPLADLSPSTEQFFKINVRSLA